MRRRQRTRAVLMHGGFLVWLVAAGQAPASQSRPTPTSRAVTPVKTVTIRYDNLRHAFLRGEQAALAFTVLAPAERGMPKAKLAVDVGGVIQAGLELGSIAPAGRAFGRVRVDTGLLKSGRYVVRCEVASAGRPLAKAEFPFWVARRWNPDRMRVWLWPHTKFGIHVKKLDEMARRQFAWYADIGVNSFQPYGELNRDKYEVFDYGLVNGWEMGVGLSGGLKDKDFGLGPETQYEARRKHMLNNPFHPAVAKKQDRKNRDMMRIVRQFPGVKTTFFNSEITDVMNGIEPPLSGRHNQDRYPVTVKHEFIMPGVIPDNDEKYAIRLYDYKWGDGLTTANLRTARMAHRYDPEHVVFTDPHRSGAILDKFPGMDLISTWTYTNPDPKYMLYIETLIATAKPTGQGVMQTVTLLNYPGTIFPKDKGWTVMGAARLVETSWINLSRRPDGLSIYLSSECDPIDTPPKKGEESWWADKQRVPYQRNPKTFAAFKGFTAGVVEPYGPAIKKLDRCPRRVAVLSSESSRVYGASPNLLGYYDNLQIYCFYTLLSMIHVPADVVFDETIVRYGLDDYDVLVLPKCETLIKTVYEKIVAFERRGGLVISDQYLRAPIPNVIKFDFDFTYRRKVSANAILENQDYARWDDQMDVKAADMKQVKGVTAELDQKLMERYAGRLRKALEGKIARVVDCSSPTALLNMLEKGRAKYLFVINDQRTYGDRVGQYQAMLDKAVPQTVTITLNRWRQPELYVYDMLEKKQLACKRSGGAYTFDVDLPGPGGKIIALLPDKIGAIEVRMPERITGRGRTADINILVKTADGLPATGIQPVRVTITDPQGGLSEFSDFYAAESGALTVGFVPAVNDAAGRWTVEAEELISGRRGTASFTLE